jgi:hypothetical protein
MARLSSSSYWHDVTANDDRGGIAQREVKTGKT